ncbi:hypothetical protein BDQ12DRAFT_386393 [Crucibulum laeve]|uniref:Uncharacterized protein n=1 Tax=Crucibulum laeve TaxID=68775 RepID=A0A5C3M9T7_9AGAR|nr:hypothetical protein BDQ12DRAFT_386393 [Crucibulum laeve]
MSESENRREKGRVGVRSGLGFGRRPIRLLALMLGRRTIRRSTARGQTRRLRRFRNPLILVSFSVLTPLQVHTRPRFLPRPPSSTKHTTILKMHRQGPLPYHHLVSY